MPFSQSLLLQLLPLLSLITTTTTLLHNVDAFTVALPVGGVLRPTRPSSTSVLIRYLSDKDTATSAFVPLNQEEEEEDDDVLDKVEMFGKGAAKAKRGKRKGETPGSSTSSAPRPSKSSLAPEEIFYEGPPAITETLAPTLSILTVVGIIPAAAAWARQAWVRYKITNRRIRVTSGMNGQDMAEIVYADIIEIRTVRRLFGDGDMVAFLRDGAKFEMRNIPNFQESMEFVLQHVDPTVVEQYRSKGDVTNG